MKYKVTVQTIDKCYIYENVTDYDGSGDMILIELDNVFYYYPKQNVFYVRVEQIQEDVEPIIITNAYKPILEAHVI